MKKELPNISVAARVWNYDGFMAALESIVKELKDLPPARLEQAAEYIHQLKKENQEEQLAILQATAGCLTNEEADEFIRALETFEHIDESSWDNDLKR